MADLQSGNVYIEKMCLWNHAFWSKTESNLKLTVNLIVN